MSGLEVIGTISAVVDLIGKCYTIYEAVNGRGKVETKLAQELKALRGHEALLDASLDIQRRQDRRYEETSNEDEKTRIKTRSDIIASKMKEAETSLKQVEIDLNDILPNASPKPWQRTLKRLQLVAPTSRQEEIASTIKSIVGDLELVRNLQLQQHQLNALGSEPEEVSTFSCWPPRTLAQKQLVNSYNNNFIGNGNNNCGNTTNNNYHGNKIDNFMGQVIEVPAMPRWQR
jgi:hypothetical protein